MFFSGLAFNKRKFVDLNFNEQSSTVKQDRKLLIFNRDDLSKNWILKILDSPSFVMIDSTKFLF